MKHLGNKIFLTALVLSSILVTRVHAEEEYFNRYIMQAVDTLSTKRGGMGYGHFAFTQDLQFGSVKLKASNPPLTMCVAAQMEIIVTALNLYIKEEKDKSVYRYLPPKQWVSLYPGSLRGKIWVVENSGSSGTASALKYFGMGREIPFSELRPGAFVNINRDHSGHAVTFVSYINSNGEELLNYDGNVAGFKYFSSQGNEKNGGFGFRYAFFKENGCPVLKSVKKRDCGVIFSKNQRILNSGQMLMPKYWDVSRRNVALNFSRATSKGPESTFDENYFNGHTTDD